MPRSEQPETFGTSRSLIDRVRADDREAWDSLCDIYAPLVYGWARKSNLQESDAEDIVQDVFRNVASGLHNFQYGGPNHSFRGWLWTITRNAIRRYFNSLKGEVAVAEGGTNAMQKMAEAPDWTITKDADEPELATSEESAMMQRALKLIEHDFADHVWQAFWRFTVDAHTAKEIAKDLDMTTAGVRQAKFRVLARLREVLG